MAWRGLLGLVASACGGVDSRFRAELVEPAAARGWQLAILLTPTGHMVVRGRRGDRATAGV